MTPNQKLFNDAFLGLKSQGFRTSKNSANCWYRHPSLPLKCAIGHCIPDEQYDQAMDAGSQTQVACNDLVQAVLFEIYPGVDMNFARKLQNVHDESDDDSLEERLIDFAKRENLEIPA